jgi:hypothetical protein
MKSLSGWFKNCAESAFIRKEREVASCLLVASEEIDPRI